LFSASKNQTQEHSFSTFKRFLEIFLKDEKEDLWILVVYGVAVSICSLVIPIAVQTFVNTIGFGLLLQPILILTFIVFAVLMFSGVMRVLQIYATEVLQQRLFAKVAMALALRIPQIDFSYLSKNKAAYEATYFLEIATLQKTATVLILDASSVILQVVFGIVLLAFYHPFLLGLNFVILLVIAVFVFGLARSAIESSIAESKSKYSVAYWLHEMAKNSLHFRTPYGRQYAAQYTDELATNYVLKRRKHFKILFRQILATIFLQILVSSLLLGVGGWLVVKGQLSLGQLVASELIVSSVVIGVGKFGKYLESFYDLAASLDKIGHLFELPTERESGETIVKGVQTQRVYQDVPLLQVRDFQLTALATSLKNRNTIPFSFEVKPREKLTIVGGDSILRSNLMKCLYGLDEKYSGTIELDRVDIKYRSIEDLRSKIAYIGKVNLMVGSVLDNFRFGNEALTLHEIQTVLDELSMSELIRNLPNGLHTSVDDESVSGDRSLTRMILLARAVLAKPELLLLDYDFDESDLRKDPLMASFLSKDHDSFALLTHGKDPQGLSIGGRIFDLPQGREIV